MDKCGTCLFEERPSTWLPCCECIRGDKYKQEHGEKAQEEGEKDEKVRDMR